MLRKVTIDGVKFPRLYIAENKADVELAQKNGIPYIKWSYGVDELIKTLLRPTLEKMFPYIKWSKVLGRRRKFSSNICMCESNDKLGEINIDDPNQPLYADEEWMEINNDFEPLTVVDDNLDELSDSEYVPVATGNRVCGGHAEPNDFVVRSFDIEDYIGDLSSQVNLDVLQKLQLMPKFIGDIMECVRINLTAGMKWSEGYNRKTNTIIGNYNHSAQLPNLIILDVSASIPRGIAATMLTLIDTLRTQCDADLIITGHISKYYSRDMELPSPQRLRDTIQPSNETIDFLNILTHAIAGRHFGNVISFGDFDAPMYGFISSEPDKYSLRGTKVDAVHHYHTHARNAKTGYAVWCHKLAEPPKIVEYNTNWCEFIKE